MKRAFSAIITAALLLPLASCAGTVDEDVATPAEAGATYTGTVIEIGLEHIVITTDDGEVLVPYSEDTEFSGFARNMAGMGNAPGQPAGGNAPPDMGGAPADAGNENGFTDLETPPDAAEGEFPSGENDMTPPEGMGEMPAGMDNGDTFEDLDRPEQAASSYEDISLNNTVTVVVGSDGTAETITLSSVNDAENGMGGETDGVSPSSEEEDSVDEESTITEE